MTDFLQFLADNPLIFLGLILGIGVGVGRFDAHGVRLGPAAVLFTAMVLTAWGTGVNVELAVPQILGDLGLALFAFTTGLMAGPSFFSTLRTAWRLVVVVSFFIVLAAAAGLALGRAFDMSPQAIAGTFAGALTNTPALAAAGGTPAATVGYASTYLIGVVTMLIMVAIGLKRGHDDPDTPSVVVDATVRIECDDVAVADLRERHGDRLTFSRMTHHAADPAVPVEDDYVLHSNDLVTVIGPKEEVAETVRELGHLSSHDLTADRSHLDFRRITISDPKLAGRRIRDLELDRLDAAITRVRRGDTDLVATPDTVIQLGDRVRVVAPHEKLKGIAGRLGDSSRGLTEINAVALGLGLALGLSIGLITVPIPGLGTLSLGAAAGSLIVGLAMGRVGRIGPVVTTMPQTSAVVISELGLLFFLAFAGTRAGSLIVKALTSGEIVHMLATGLVMSLILSVGSYTVMRWGLKVGRIRMGGVLAGAQTNPAHLAFANSRSDHDPRVAVGYALVYPAAMVVKILLAQLLSIT